MAFFIQIKETPLPSKHRRSWTNSKQFLNKPRLFKGIDADLYLLILACFVASGRVYCKRICSLHLRMPLSKGASNPLSFSHLVLFTFFIPWPPQKRFSPYCFDHQISCFEMCRQQLHLLFPSSFLSSLEKRWFD